MTLLDYFTGKIQILALKLNPLLDVKWGKKTFFFLVNRKIFFQLYIKGKSDIWNLSMKKTDLNRNWKPYNMHIDENNFKETVKKTVAYI